MRKHSNPLYLIQKGPLFNFRAKTMRIKHENTLYLEKSLSNESFLEEDSSLDDSLSDIETINQ